MKGYEFVTHTGDVKIKVYDSTKEELFKNALEGMGAILKSKINPSAGSGQENQKLKFRKFEVRSFDVNALLVDFLNEVNYLRQVNNETYTEVEFKNFSDNEAEGAVRGFEVSEFGEDIKAVTFHEVDIHKNNEGQWETNIVFDV